MAPARCPEDAPRWLAPQEMAAWLGLLRVVQLLPQALDKQLREDAGIHHTYYMVLALLSAAPDQRLSMSELAKQAATSPSRLTHAMSSLEERGWVCRQPCPGDRRVQHAALTAEGAQLLERVAPGHVEEVRRLVFDRLAPEDVAELERLTGKLLAALDG